VVVDAAASSVAPALNSTLHFAKLVRVVEDGLALVVVVAVLISLTMSG
jgi:hypothetical protein